MNSHLTRQELHVFSLTFTDISIRQNAAMVDDTWNADFILIMEFHMQLLCIWRHWAIQNNLWSIPNYPIPLYLLPLVGFQLPYWILWVNVSEQSQRNLQRSFLIWASTLCWFLDETTFWCMWHRVNPEIMCVSFVIFSYDQSCCFKQFHWYPTHCKPEWITMNYPKPWYHQKVSGSHKKRNWFGRLLIQFISTVEVRSKT